MLALFLLTTLLQQVTALDNWCIWVGVDADFLSWERIASTIAIEAIYLFDARECEGPTCMLTQEDGASPTGEDERPTQATAYTCDGAAHLVPNELAPYFVNDHAFQTHYVCTCSGSLEPSIPITYKNQSSQIACNNDNGDFCGTFAEQTYYCGTNGSVSNDVRTETFDDCVEKRSCNSAGLCVSYGHGEFDDENDTPKQRYEACIGATGSEGETLYGNGGSASASTTHSCGPCVLRPSLDPRCAAKYNVTAENSPSTTTTASGGLAASVRTATPMMALAGIFAMFAL